MQATASEMPGSSIGFGKHYYLNGGTRFTRRGSGWRASLSTNFHSGSRALRIRYTRLLGHEDARTRYEARGFGRAVVEVDLPVG